MRLVISAEEGARHRRRVLQHVSGIPVRPSTRNVLGLARWLASPWHRRLRLYVPGVHTLVPSDVNQSR